MKTNVYLWGLVVFALAGCAVDEPVPVTTTTEVTREVTTTGPATREVLVTQAPPAVRVETQTVSPGQYENENPVCLSAMRRDVAQVDRAVSNVSTVEHVR